jgi:ATP-dependent protease ClpP protease subunit
MHLYGVIGMDVRSADVAGALAEAKGPLTVYVNSPGGDYFEGKAIFSALARYAQRNKLTVVVDGVAASSASFIAMAATRIEMSPSASLMVHEVHGGAAGRAQDLEAAAALIRGENQTLASIYSKRTGIPVDQVAAMLANGDTWFSAEEAVAQHFADGIEGEKPAPRPPPRNALTKRIQNLRINALQASLASAPGQPGR